MKAKNIAVAVSALVLSAQVFAQTNITGLTIDPIPADSGNFSIYSNSDAPSFIKGRLGLGTDAPQGDLVVTGKRMLFGANQIIGSFQPDETVFQIHSASNVSLGAFATANGTDMNAIFLHSAPEYDWAGLQVTTFGSGAPQIPFKIFTGTTERFRIEAAGNVGIGFAIADSIDSQYLVSINGSLAAKQIIVTDDIIPADYVFDDNYQLRDLTEVEQFIDDNKHLPDVPSGSEMIAEGVNLIDMQMKLLQKIEELTVYVIAQDKRLKAVENENIELKRVLAKAP